MGALDENGNPGYLHDETALRLSPPPFVLSPSEKQAACAKNLDGNFEMMTQIVKVSTPPAHTKLFCTIYSHEKSHASVLPHVISTWAPKCDGFMVASTKTDKSLHTVEILHEGPEEYNNIWQKVRSTWAYVHDNYLEDYEWFYIGGDDVFLVVENLKTYLYSDEIVQAGKNEFGQDVPLFLGRRFKEGGDIEKVFNSGGAG